MAGDLMFAHAHYAAKPMPCPVPLATVLYGRPMNINTDLVRRPHWFISEKPKETGFSALPVKQRRDLLLANLSRDEWIGTDAIHAATGANRCGILKAMHGLAKAGTISERGKKGPGYEWRLK